jgi:hypothetical protein
MAVGGLALGAFLYFGVYRPYEDMKAEAARVPALVAANKGLSDQMAATEKRIAQVNVDLAIAQGQRDQAVSDLGKWNDNKNGLFADLGRMTKNATASTNTVCLPTADERKLWNATLASLTAANTSARSIGAEGKVPGNPGGVH